MTLHNYLSINTQELIKQNRKEKINIKITHLYYKKEHKGLYERYCIM